LESYNWFLIVSSFSHKSINDLVTNVIKKNVIQLTVCNAYYSIWSSFELISKLLKHNWRFYDDANNDLFTLFQYSNFFLKCGVIVTMIFGSTKKNTQENVEMKRSPNGDEILEHLYTPLFDFWRMLFKNFILTKLLRYNVLS